MIAPGKLAGRADSRPSIGKFVCPSRATSLDEERREDEESSPDRALIYPRFSVTRGGIRERREKSRRGVNRGMLARIPVSTAVPRVRGSRVSRVESRRCHGVPAARGGSVFTRSRAHCAFHPIIITTIGPRGSSRARRDAVREPSRAEPSVR